MKGKMSLFVDEYMKDLNPTEAYLRAGYKVPNRKRANMLSAILMRHPVVVEEIKARTDVRREKSDLTVQYIINKLIDVIETEGQKPEAVLRGLELAGRHLGMYRDKQEISGPDGSAIQVQEQKVAADVADFRSRIAGLATRNGSNVVPLRPTDEDKRSMP